MFASYPTAFVYDKPGGKKKEHLLWGDLIEALGSRQGDWIEVRARNSHGWMQESDTQTAQLLELDFVDVSQGDGVFVLTPDNRLILIDAGAQDNMYRFLNWRFRHDKRAPVKINTAIITHSDTDHSKGFEPFFKDVRYSFGQVFHNGLVGRGGGKPLGMIEEIGEHRYVTELIADRESLDHITAGPDKAKLPDYTRMLQAASRSERVGDIRMLCSEDCFLPGYDNTSPPVIRILGPVPELGVDGKRILRWFKDEGKTKNGHSIILKLEYGKVRILLGGDLNIPAEEYLLQHYSHLDPKMCQTSADQEQLVMAARHTFEADAAKACHHGSADFTDLFLRSVNSIATIVSSGDNEPYAHPRPDTLGALGRYGRGPRPLIFSTELARSTKDLIKQPQVLREEINGLIRNGSQIKSEKERNARIKKCLEQLERSVAVYGMINLRTDGTRVLLAQKFERAAPNGNRWDVHLLEPGPDGFLEYLSKH